MTATVLLLGAAMALGIAALVVVAPILRAHPPRRPNRSWPLAGVAVVVGTSRAVLMVTAGVDLAGVVTLAGCGALLVAAIRLGRVLRALDDQRDHLAKPRPGERGG